MTSTAAAPQAGHRREARATMLLSLDLTRPFLDAIGLSTHEQIPWTECARDFVRQYRRQFYAGDVPAGAEGPLGVVEFARRRVGTPAGEALRSWLGCVYSEAPSEHPEYRAWENVFRLARRRPTVWAQLGLPPGIAEEVRQRFEAAIDPDHLEPIWVPVRSVPLSDWDLHMYAVNAWNDDLPDAPNGPESQIYLIARDHRNRWFWESLVAECSSAEQERLHRSAQAVVDGTPELAYVGALPAPASLEFRCP